jgi:hypothetical protein
LRSCNGHKGKEQRFTVLTETVLSPPVGIMDNSSFNNPKHMSLNAVSIKIEFGTIFSFTLAEAAAFLFM